MKFLKKIESEWYLFWDEIRETILLRWITPEDSEDNRFGNRIILIFIAIGFVSFLAFKYPIPFSLFWLSIPLLILLFNLLNVGIPVSFRNILIAIVISMSIGVYLSKNEFRDFIGNNAIKGYDSYYETVYYVTDYDDYEREEHRFVADHWTGRLIIRIFDYLIIVAIIIVPYITWKFALKK